MGTFIRQRSCSGLYPSQVRRRGWRFGTRAAWPWLGAILAVVAGTAPQHEALAQTFTWNGSVDSNFRAQANWSGPTATLPGASNIVLFNSTTPNAVTLTSTTNSAFSVQGIRLTDGTGLISMPSLITQGFLNIGSSGIDMSSATRDLTLPWLEAVSKPLQI